MLLEKQYNSIFCLYISALSVMIVFIRCLHFNTDILLIAVAIIICCLLIFFFNMIFGILDLANCWTVATNVIMCCRWHLLKFSGKILKKYLRILLHLFWLWHVKRFKQLGRGWRKENGGGWYFHCFVWGEKGWKEEMWCVLEKRVEMGKGWGMLWFYIFFLHSFNI